MTKYLSAALLAGLSFSASAHTSGTSTGIHMVEHALPFILLTMVCALVFRIFSKK